MKPQTLFIAFAALFLSGCCTKKGCIEETRVHISFHGFEPSEIDTIYCTGYEISSGFTKVGSPEQADTVMIWGQSDPEMVLVKRIAQQPVNGSGEGLEDTYEWKVYIPSVNRTLLISNYGYKSYKCNRCFPYSPPDNKVRTLTTCSVNGVESNVQDVKVYK